MMYAEEMLQHKAVELTVLDQMPDTNALSPTYCLPRIPLLPPTSTYATSYEHLCYLLRVPATDPGLLGFAACSKKHLRYCVMGCFTTPESLSGCHSLPQHGQPGQAVVQKIGGGIVCTFHIPRNNFLQKALCQR